MVAGHTSQWRRYWKDSRRKGKPGQESVRPWKGLSRPEEVKWSRRSWGVKMKKRKRSERRLLPPQWGWNVGEAWGRWCPRRKGKRIHSQSAGSCWVRSLDGGSKDQLGRACLCEVDRSVEGSKGKAVCPNCWGKEFATLPNHSRGDDGSCGCPEGSRLLVGIPSISWRRSSCILGWDTLGRRTWKYACRMQTGLWEERWVRLERPRRWDQRYGLSGWRSPKPYQRDLLSSRRWVLRFGDLHRPSFCERLSWHISQWKMWSSTSTRGPSPWGWVWAKRIQVVEVPRERGLAIAKHVREWKGSWTARTMRPLRWLARVLAREWPSGCTMAWGPILCDPVRLASTCRGVTDTPDKPATSTNFKRKRVLRVLQLRCFPRVVGWLVKFAGVLLWNTLVCRNKGTANWNLVLWEGSQLGVVECCLTLWCHFGSSHQWVVWRKAPRTESQSFSRPAHPAFPVSCRWVSWSGLTKCRPWQGCSESYQGSGSDPVAGTLGQREGSNGLLPSSSDQVGLSDRQSSAKHVWHMWQAHLFLVWGLAMLGWVAPPRFRTLAYARSVTRSVGCVTSVLASKFPGPGDIRSMFKWMGQKLMLVWRLQPKMGWGSPLRSSAVVLGRPAADIREEITQALAAQDDSLTPGCDWGRYRCVPWSHDHVLVVLAREVAQWLHHGMGADPVWSSEVGQHMQGCDRHTRQTATSTNFKRKRVLRVLQLRCFPRVVGWGWLVKFAGVLFWLNENGQKEQFGSFCLDHSKMSAEPIQCLKRLHQTKKEFWNVEPTGESRSQTLYYTNIFIHVQSQPTHCTRLFR